MARLRRLARNIDAGAIEEGDLAILGELGAALADALR